MSESLAYLVDRGLQIRSEIKKLEVELKEIETKLKKRAQDKPEAHQELKDAEREGRRFLAKGTSNILPITFTADKLVQSFAKGTKHHQQIELAAGSKFLTFFKPYEGFESLFPDGKEFRNQATAHLGDRAPMFITACLARDRKGIPKSDIKIEWEDARPIEEVA